MMKGFRVVISCLFCFLITAQLKGAEPFFIVNMEGTLPVQILPRSKATVILSVENREAALARIALTPRLPPAWKQITPLFPLELAAGETDIFLLNFFVPESVLSGSYQVEFTLENLEQKVSIYEGSIPVEVLPEKKFEVRLLEKPEYTIAGEEYTVSYLLYNTGNTEIRLILDVKSSDGFASTISGDGLEKHTLPDITNPQDTGSREENGMLLTPGEAKNIIITTRTAKNINSIISHRITLTTALSGPDPVMEAGQSRSLTSYVEIIPVRSGIREMYHKLPLIIKYNTTQGYLGAYTGDLGINLYSKGTLDEEGAHHLEVEINKKLDFIHPAFFDYADQYTLEYWTSGLKLSAGDRGYSLSPLTENFEYGRGMEGDFTFGPWDAGAYYQQNVWVENSPGHAGSFFRYTLENAAFPGGYQYSAAVNLLGKINNGILCGLYQDYKPVPELILEAEAAAGAPFNKDLQFAWLLKANGDHHWITYNLAYVYADPFYPGNYTDLSLLSGNLGLRLLDSTLKIYGGYLYEDHNARLDASLLSAALNLTAQTGIEYLIKPLKTECAFLWKNNNRFDRLAVQDFDYAENIFKLNILQPFPQFKLRPAVEVRIYEDRLYQVTSYNQDYLLGLEYTPDDLSLFNFFLEYNRQEETLTPVRQKFTWGINTSLNFSELLLDFQFRNNLNLWGEKLEELDFSFNLGSSYQFKDFTKLAANLNYVLFNSASQWNNYFSLALTYTTPVQIPVVKKKNIGSIKGVIHNSITGMPVPGIILRIGGLSSVTDEKGNFIFPALEPGEYYINLNRKSMKEDLIPCINMPARIRVESGETVNLDISLTSAVTIAGKLSLYDFPNTSNTFTAPAPGEESNQDDTEYVYIDAPGFIIEISNGKEIKRRVTDKSGNFRFEELAPGNWNLKVLDYGIPRYHYIEKDSFDLNLLPGETHTFSIRILPEKRFITIIEDGGTLVAE